MKIISTSKRHLIPGCLFFILLSFALFKPSLAQEIRAAWLVRYDWKTKNQVDDILSVAVKNGITDIYIQIRGRGDAYYKESYEPYAQSFNDSHDRLKEFLSKGRQLNIRIHAWINVFLVGSDRDKPFPRNHVLSLHPEWVIKDENNRSLLDYKFNEYGPKLLEGIYLNPSLDEVLNYHLRLINHIIKNYPFDGIHLDYFRLPSKAFYNSEKISPKNVSKKLGHFLFEVKKGMLKYRVNSVLSVAVKSDLKNAKNEYGQDWASWLNKKYIDYTVAMNYTKSNSIFLSKIEEIPGSLRNKIVMGISIYDKPFSQAQWQVKAALENGFTKISFFSMKYLK